MVTALLSLEESLTAMFRLLAVVVVAVLTIVSTSITSSAEETATGTPAENSKVGDSSWVISGVANQARLAGYVVGKNVLEGQEAVFKVHSPGSDVSVDIYRVGHYDGAGGRLVTSLDAQPGTTQPGCTRNALEMVDCAHWSPTHRVSTAGWEPGLYLAKLKNAAGEQYAPFLLRSASHQGTVTIVTATTTHEAYNRYGGYSLYTGLPACESGQWQGCGFDNRARQVSFNRPHAGNGADKMYNWEVGLIQHLESLGVELSYTTNRELDMGHAQYSGTSTMVFLGHDEYWSTSMRSTVEQLRDSGTNLLFLGANTSYVRIRWSADRSNFISYKIAAEDPVQGPETTATWRGAPSPNPEASLLGSQYVCNGKHGQKMEPLVITDPDFWGFKDTGVTKGQQFPGMVGWEVDAVTAASPKNTIVAASSPFECPTYWAEGQITYYSAPSGAGVVNLGTFGFAFSVSWFRADDDVKRFSKQVVANLVTEAAAGPLGARYPTVAPPQPPAPPNFETHPQLLYVTEGTHEVNGRLWRTDCEPYSQSQRCFTEIWGTTVKKQGSRFTKTEGWTFNNLTYLPQPNKQLWRDNPLARTTSWTAEDGRQWRTECGTPETGRDGCRSWVSARIIVATPNGRGGYSYSWQQRWVFNNIVRL